MRLQFNMWGAILMCVLGTGMAYKISFGVRISGEAQSQTDGVNSTIDSQGVLHLQLTQGLTRIVATTPSQWFKDNLGAAMPSVQSLSLPWINYTDTDTAIILGVYFKEIIIHDEHRQYRLEHVKIGVGYTGIFAAAYWSAPCFYAFDAKLAYSACCPIVDVKNSDSWSILHIKAKSTDALHSLNFSSKIYHDTQDVGKYCPQSITTEFPHGNTTELPLLTFTQPTNESLTVFKPTHSPRLNYDVIPSVHQGGLQLKLPKYHYGKKYNSSWWGNDDNLAVTSNPGLLTNSTIAVGHYFEQLVLKHSSTKDSSTIELYIIEKVKVGLDSDNLFYLKSENCKANQLRNLCCTARISGSNLSAEIKFQAPDVRLPKNVINVAVR
eukprot:CAMPEP_0203760354 /NCGR_PEP_ID=MMETSP0098-20131031/13665_1 /ASSEMBLY_ACC=CAM_ASM_000208 /TAXON_ID=96639 /ORGANISM=" , Strain NY0313808BC1" /LENGTH=379 /DNA_ID=CAMNT_0050653877 /DNA_START=693 /DNA_END=1828 /DNA_ORIENTATION=-